MRGVRFINTGDFIAYLQDLGVRLSAEGERLHVSAPKNKLPTDLRAEIAERKADILTLLYQRSSTKRIPAPPIKPRGRSEPAPLSFAQERLWFLEQLEPESSVYNICRASRLLGNLNASALEASLNEIISRHEALRTAFRLVDGRPVQVVQPIQNISIQSVDLRAKPDDEHDVEIRRRIKVEAERPFDLTAGLLLRSTLLRAGDDEYVLILMTHHSAADAWSMGILTRELWTLYDAFSKGNLSPLELLPVQYSDYAVWQRNWLQSEVLDPQIAYWKKQLENLAVLDPPTDRPRPPRQSFHGARVAITLSQALTESVNELSTRFALTPFMTLLAAFQVLLSRYSGQDDIAVGSAVANRRRPEIENLIGFFVNTLVLRSDLSGTPSFRELLSRVKNTCVAAVANQDLPFEKLVQELQPERDRSRNPLFQVMFVLQNATSPFRGIPGLRVQPIDLETTRSPFDLSLFLRERNGKYIGYMEYNTDLFNRDRIARMGGHFQTLLEAIVADPDQSIATLPILTEAERHQLLVEWNDTEADYPKDKCIHQLFEEQVERTPDAIALEFEDKSITYQELNRRANQLAHYVISLGIGPEKLVGICVERSIEMVVGLLGILKAGGAYVPLDPGYPKARLRFMLADSNVPLLLTQAKLIRGSGWMPVEGMDDGDSLVIPRLDVVYLDSDLPVVERYSRDNPSTQVCSDSIAYIIYTSGSTGQPKGVLGTHRGAVNRFSWMWNKFPFAPNEKCCAKTSLNFVDSVWETFGPLLQGVTTTLIADDVIKDVSRFVQALAKGKITRIVLVPSFLQAMFNSVPEIHSLLPDLSLWTCSGESLPIQLADQFRSCLSGKKLLNLYGSSEVAADVTCFDCNDRVHGSIMQIGRPIQNTKIYILDAHLNLVPVGVPGELYIGGIGLAAGYLERPELTADKFINNLFSDEIDSKLYRSGDLGRYMANGSIEFLGRLDNQVKVHGNRVELGEIETAILQNSAIKTCVAVLQKIQPIGNDQVVAYIVPTTSSECSIAALRKFLVGKLPAFMLPNHFVILERLPLTLNGKLDRKALQASDGLSQQPQTEFVAPQTEIEELVAQSWRGTLNLERIGVHDNFFAVGGHSLLAAQLLTRLCSSFAKPISLAMFFEDPTIAGLASRLEPNADSAGTEDLPPISCVSHKGALPISVSQEPFFMVDQLVGGASFLNMPYAYRLAGPLNVSALKRTIGEIVRRQLNLQMTFAEINGRPTQTIGPLQKTRLPLIDLSRLPPDEKEKRLINFSAKDAKLRFKLRSGPVFRLKLIRLEKEKHVLLVTMHHIVTDQWSMRVFRTELEAIYSAFAQNQVSPLPEPYLQFVDFVVWQSRLLKKGQFRDQLSYWKEQLAQPLSTLAFHQHGEIKREKVRFRSDRQPVEINFHQFQDIKSFALRECCTTFMIFVTALSILLHLLTGQQDIRISTLAANRGRPGTEQIIGYFVNMLVLRNHVDPNMTVREMLKQVRDVCLAAYARQDLPFDYLATTLEKEGFKEPLAQVMLNYRNYPMPSRETAGLSIASWNGQIRSRDHGLMISRLDMMFHLRDTTTKLTGAVNYKTDVFSKHQIRKMINGFQTIATHLPFQADVPIFNYQAYVDK